MSDEEPKQRYISLDAMMLAYLGDFLKNFEQGIQAQVKQHQTPANNRTHQEQSPGDQ
jgi:hypothetical protein